MNEGSRQEEGPVEHSLNRFDSEVWRPSSPASPRSEQPVRAANGSCNGHICPLPASFSETANKPPASTVALSL